MLDSHAVRDRLAEVESEAETVMSRIDMLRRALSDPVDLPNDTWIAEQMGNIATLLHADERQAAVALRSLLGRVHAHQVLLPGKQRGYVQLRFRINGWEVLREILGNRIPSSALVALLPEDTGSEGASEEFRIDLGAPSLMDQWAPKIAELRAKGVRWVEICEVSGLDLNRAYIAWKRYVDAQPSSGNASDGSPIDDRPDESDEPPGQPPPVRTAAPAKPGPWAHP